MMGIVLMFGISACTCTRQNGSTTDEEVTVADSTIVATDTTVVGYVAGEENVAL